MKPIAIIGAGNGGCAMAAQLTLMGLPVHLCEIYVPQRITDLRKRGGIELGGAAGNGLATPQMMTTDLGEALRDADFIFWTVPANGHDLHVRRLGPHWKPGQILILTPGAVGGALFVRNSLQPLHREGVLVGETCTLPYGCRLTSPFHVEVYDVAREILFAMLPDAETERVLNTIQPIFPHLIRGETVLDTSLNYMNMLFHPVGMILNAGWIEHRRGDFAYYYDGISPAVARVLEETDRERLDILRALGLNAVPFVEWFFRRGKTTNKENVYAAVRASLPNRNFRAPENLEHRFLLEDVPFGLVPLAQFGRLLGVATPVIDALVLLASKMCNRDFFREGRNLEQMGIEKMTPAELKKFAAEGR